MGSLSEGSCEIPLKDGISVENYGTAISSKCYVCGLTNPIVDCENCKTIYHYECAYRVLDWKCKQCGNNFASFGNLLQSSIEYTKRCFVYLMLLPIILQLITFLALYCVNMMDNILIISVSVTIPYTVTMYIIFGIHIYYYYRNIKQLTDIWKLFIPFFSYYIATNLIVGLIMVIRNTDILIYIICHTAFIIFYIIIDILKLMYKKLENNLEEGSGENV